MGILAVICSVGLDLAGLGFRILVWCSNGGFGVWFGVSEVVVVVLLLFGWFGASWWLVWWCWCFSEFGC